MLQKLVGDGHPDTSYSLAFLGRTLLFQDRLLEAESCLHRALEVDAKAQATNGWNHALSLSFLTDILTKQEKWDEAEGEAPNAPSRCDCQKPEGRG